MMLRTPKILGRLLMATGFFAALGCGSSQPGRSSSQELASGAAPGEGATGHSDTGHSDSDDELDYDPETLVSFDLVGPLRSQGELHIGARFQIQEGWHLYWINPGDSGLPTRVSFEDDAKLRVGALQFPGPRRFGAPGDLSNYGYRDELVLPVAIELSQESNEARVQATAKWLACRDDACVPGQGSSELAVSSSDGGEAPALSRALATLPKALASIAEIGGKYEISSQAGRARVRIRISGASAADLFPVFDKAVEHVKIERIETGAVVDFVLLAHEDDSELAVLSVQTESGTHFYSITSELLAIP